MEIILNDEQQVAFDKIIEFILYGDHKTQYFTLEGKAGTGKTVVLAKVVEFMKHRRFIISAISHKAKDVLASRIFSKNVTAMTVAAALAMKFDDETGKFIRDPYAKIVPISEADIFIADEGSMLDLPAIDYMMKKKLHKTVLIFAGDKGQLPPISSDGKSKDIYSPIFSCANKVRLLTRVRQGEDSPILTHMDYFWDFTEKDNQDIYNILRPDAVTDKGSIWYTNNIRGLIVNYAHHYRQAVAEGNTNLIKAVCYKNDNRKIINNLVRQAVFDNPNTYEVGDLMIMQDTYQDDHVKVENSTEFALTSIKRGVKTIDDAKFRSYLLNGTYVNGQGIRKYVSLPVIDEESREDFNMYTSQLFAEAKDLPFGDQRSNLMAKAWAMTRIFAKVEYGYAMTSHKVQGSTYDIVLVNLTDMLRSRNVPQEKAAMIYTAGTRARKEVVMCNKDWDEKDLINR